MTRLAIVNRGEPAMRALDAIDELNRSGVDPPMTSVVLYTEPDTDAWFVHQADEAIPLGPAYFTDPADGSRKSAYLDEERVVELLSEAEVDAVWVGWGFVAEHASFAQRCEKAGITFVGPPSATIRLLGDKIEAKRLAETVGVPVTAWSEGPISAADDGAAHAKRIGFPLLVKAAAGGGGRGIRLVRDLVDLPAAVRAAREEAALAFGDPSVFLEQFVSRARHVEVQIIADDYGAVWPVGIRDCSVQRRNQKVLEESASTILTAEQEDAIKNAAVRIAGAASYRNAGTVEFLVDPETGQFHFMEVNTRLQVEHPITEQTSGVDLVKLQLHVAFGGRLTGAPPTARGHAIEARLCAEDPEKGFAPAPGRIILWRPPTGPGIRVDTGVVEGDVIAAEFDSLIAKVIAWGADRDEAVARLRRALARAVVVIDGGTTNRSFLLSLLSHPDFRAGDIDNHWLDRLADRALLAPPADPVAVVVAAIEAYEAEETAQREAFHAGARRGRPEIQDTVGHQMRLRYRGEPYAVQVFRTGRYDYAVDTGAHTVRASVHRIGEYERRVTCAGAAHQVTVVEQHSSFLLDVDDTAHRVYRDDGGIVRADGPAFVISVLVREGQRVAAHDPLLVLESMKMETTLTAPFGGDVAEIFVAPKTQVDSAVSLVRIREEITEAAGEAQATVDFAPLAAADTGAPPEHALHRYLLGYDLDPASVRAALVQLRPDASGIQTLLELFADVAALYRPQPADAETSGREYTLAYLQWLDVDRAGLPDDFRYYLQRMLARYGVASLEPTPALEQAVVWLWRSLRRADELATPIAEVLANQLRRRDDLRDAGHSRPLLAQLADAAQTRYPEVAELARDLLFHYFDEPVLERAVAEMYVKADDQLAALAADPARRDRDELLQQLVWCPQPLRGAILHRWTGASEAYREVLLDLHLRRFYRVRELHDVRFDRRSGYQLGLADYEVDDKKVHLVTAYAPQSELAALAAALSEHLKDVAPERLVVLDLVVWTDKVAKPDAISDDLAEVFGKAKLDVLIHRLDIAVTCGGTEPEHNRTHRFTFRVRDGRFVEETLYRNLHPMIAKRMNIWRLDNFVLERLRSVEDVYLFRAVARENPNDVRLFALAEVRDLTPVLDEAGEVAGLPLLERIGLQAIAAMRDAIASTTRGSRPQANRLVLYVRPPFTLPPHRWPELARRFEQLGAAARMQKIVLRVRLPEGDRIIEFSPSGIRVRPPAQTPIRPLTDYAQRVLRAARVGAPYPYEVVRMLTSSGGAFAEHDLTALGELIPADRPYGQNTANLVVGLITNRLGDLDATRVAIFGDPTRRMGSLAEPECRRVIAALDMAERLQMPVEWFAVSSGARIAMDSGTENMDWIGAVLRRIVGFTQAGGELNVVVTGINVGAQPYWNAEATMLMHTRGILIMTPASAMVLTGKQALDYSGGVSADDNFGIGGYEHVMGPNGQGQYFAATLPDACRLLLRHYEYTYLVPGERFPRRRPTDDPRDRDVRSAPHTPARGCEFTTVGDVFSAQHNPERKKPFDIRSVMRAVADADAEPLERWSRWRGAESAVVWDAQVGGHPLCLLGIESRSLARRGYQPADGPTQWTSGTLFPQSSRKIARAINAASGNRPVVVLANLSGFDGSPESMRRRQLEYGAEIGRAVTNFRGPIVFVVVSRYHGGAFVVFSKRLNDNLEIAAVEGSYASVIGGAPAAGVVFVRDVDARTDADPRVAALRAQVAAGNDVRGRLAEVRATVRAEKLGEVAAEFDGIHDISRAQRMGSVDRIIPARDLRPYVIDAVERGMAAAAAAGG